MDDAKLIDLIGGIYEAPGDPDAWQRLVGRIAATFDAEHAHYAVADVGGPRIICDFVTSSEAGESYARDYAVHDKAVHRVLRGADRKAVTRFELLSDDEVRRCPVHQEFLPRFGAEHRLWVKSDLGGGLTFLSTALRSQRRGAFSPDEYRRLEILHPHTERAMRLHLELQRARAHADSLEAGLDTLAMGLVLLDSRGSVLFANRAARAVLDSRDGVALERGAIVATAPSAQGRMQKLLARALGLAGIRASGGSIALPRNERRPLAVRALPLKTAIDLLTPRAAVAVLIRDPERPVLLDSTWLKELGLSPAEGRLAAALCTGESLEDYAAATGLRRETVRSTVKSALAKTGTHRQAELVALLLRGALG